MVSFETLIATNPFEVRHRRSCNRPTPTRHIGRYGPRFGKDRIISNLVIGQFAASAKMGGRQPRSRCAIELYLICLFDMNGPKQPYMGSTDAAAQLHRTGHSPTLQHL